MGSTKQSLGQQAREKLLRRIEQVKAGNPKPASSLGDTFTQTTMEPGDLELSQENPQEIATVGPRLKPFSSNPTASNQPTPPSPGFISSPLIDVDTYVPSSACSEPLSIGLPPSLKRKSDSSPSSIMKKGKAHVNPTGVQALAFEQLQEHLSQSERSKEQLQVEVCRLRAYLQDREKHCFVLGKRMSSLSKRVGELEEALQASSDRMMQV